MWNGLVIVFSVLLLTVKVFLWSNFNIDHGLDLDNLLQTWKRCQS